MHVQMQEIMLVQIAMLEIALEVMLMQTQMHVQMPEVMHKTVLVQTVMQEANNYSM